jgi:hypothetical protein
VAPLRVGGINLSPVAWTPRERMEYADWVAVGNRLGSLGRCSQWWLGDWIRFGNTRFGERYARAARITGYDVQTLTNMVYVATRFEISRRREDISWSHHEAIAALDRDEQNRWLDRVTTERLSVSDLRIELRAARRQAHMSSPLRREPSSAKHVTRLASSRRRAAMFTCPRCGYDLSTLQTP